MDTIIFSIISKCFVNTDQCVKKERGCGALFRTASNFFIIQNTVYSHTVFFLTGKKTLK